MKIILFLLLASVCHADLGTANFATGFGKGFMRGYLKSKQREVYVKEHYRREKLIKEHRRTWPNETTDDNYSENPEENPNLD